MGEKKVVDALIEGGKATAGPPLGPILGPLGVNTLMIVNKINDLTKSYSGMKVPVKIEVDLDTKDFEVEVGTPTSSALIIKELGVEKGSANPSTETVGNLTKEQVVNIARMKMETSYAKSVKGSLKEVLGACLSMGVTVDDRDVREVLKEIDEGVFDDQISE